MGTDCQMVRFITLHHAFSCLYSIIVCNCYSRNASCELNLIYTFLLLLLNNSGKKPVAIATMSSLCVFIIDTLTKKY
jgi:hypothetical protein